jgi:transcriptional regulator with XRE-family HTH domain
MVIGRHRLRYHGLFHNWPYVMGPRYEDLEARHRWELYYRTPYTGMIGARLKRLRLARGLSQLQARERVRRPTGGAYSQGLLSRLEKGYANSPLYVYLHFAEAYEVDPGRLMGSDDAQKPITEAEMTLIRFMRRAKLKPDEAIARLTAR